MQNSQKTVPVAALRFNVGEFVIDNRNGENAKSAPVTLKARSGQPIDHWYWGKVVHDLSGMKLHKPRLAIDYNHNADEVIGYLNHFDVSSGDLIARGALVPYKGDDRATEILFKAQQGVPYEASIFFGGDGILVEEVAEGHVAEVNGYKLEGPAAIIREWPLRGVAICPYGADANTETKLADGGESKTVTIKRKKGEDMETKLAEGAPAPVDAPAVDAKTEETKPEDKKTEETAPETAPVVETELAAKPKPGQKFIDAFGREKGGAWFAEGLTFEDAERAFNAEIRAERDALAKENAEMKTRLAAMATAGIEPVTQSEPAPITTSPKTFAQLVDEKIAATKCKRTDAMRIVAKENPAAWEASKKQSKK
jgi:hypothetical protein